MFSALGPFKHTKIGDTLLIQVKENKIYSHKKMSRNLFTRKSRIESCGWLIWLIGSCFGGMSHTVSMRHSKVWVECELGVGFHRNLTSRRKMPEHQSALKSSSSACQTLSVFKHSQLQLSYYSLPSSQGCLERGKYFVYSKYVSCLAPGLSSPRRLTLVLHVLWYGCVCHP